MDGVNLGHRAIQDLYWAIGSMPIMAETDGSDLWYSPQWYSDQVKALNCACPDLKDNPDQLIAFLEERRTHRLGSYFEALWAFWLQQQSRYELIASNLVVRDEKRTLGEFDLIVQDTETARTLHWELAVKFYLGVQPLEQWSSWWGPKQKDRLDIKLDRLTSHQVKLSENATAKRQLETQGLCIDESHIIMKGRLFYPFGEERIMPNGSAKAHEHGRWMSFDSFEKSEELLSAQWVRLERMLWFSMIDKDTSIHGMGGIELAQWLRRAKVDYPVCIARIIYGEETDRMFIVPDDWEQFSKKGSSR